MNIAAAGLIRQRALNERGEDESIYLMRLTDLVRSGHSHASLSIEQLERPLELYVERLVEGCSI